MQDESATKTGDHILQLKSHFKCRRCSVYHILYKMLSFQAGTTAAVN